jgi:hypothetical protein
METNPKPDDVFISYARENANWVEPNFYPAPSGAQIAGVFRGLACDQALVRHGTRPNFPAGALQRVNRQLRIVTHHVLDRLLHLAQGPRRSRDPAAHRQPAFGRRDAGTGAR